MPKHLKSSDLPPELLEEITKQLKAEHGEGITIKFAGDGDPNEMSDESLEADALLDAYRTLSRETGCCSICREPWPGDYPGEEGSKIPLGWITTTSLADEEDWAWECATCADDRETDGCVISPVNTPAGGDA